MPDPQITALQFMFSPWRNASNPPAASTLTRHLEAIHRAHHTTGAKSFVVHFTHNDAKYFASAALDIWQRAVHSLLVSAALTRESFLWSSVSGYYATHYTFRALAHLMGCYQLFRLRWTVTLAIDNGQIVATFRKGTEREHDWYRQIVSKAACLNSDPFFRAPNPHDDLNDTSHRDRANYVDHLGLPPTIHDLHREAIRNKLQQFSQMEVTTPSSFSLDAFPDVNAVQINAYQRIVRFRRFLDETLDDNNRLWETLRNPGWATYYTNFQYVEPRGAVQR